MTKPRDRYVEGVKAGSILASALWWALFAVYIFFEWGVFG